jgi:alkylhydroperoxidase/carboxymuconolactone decarboxylase family protein
VQDPPAAEQQHNEVFMNYYESKDLARFQEVGQFRGELMEKFFAYYNAVVGQDGALTKREKALIALAVSHVKQCPYCIDAYTTACLEAGSNPEQMTEAIHVGAAMEAGINLVHGVQMHNALRQKGAM